MKVTGTDLNFTREPMAAPWGFKGGYLSEIWHSHATLKTDSGGEAVGDGCQSVLWCDPRVFTSTSEAGGNTWMLAVTQRALQLAVGKEADNPPALLQAILPEAWEYAQQVTGIDVTLTFVLNALASIDFASWILKARQMSAASFEDIIPESVRPAVSHRHKRLLSVPAVGYAMKIPDVIKLADAGYKVLKIKIGSDPEHDGDRDKMVDWDCRRLSDLHDALKAYDVKYYLDANSRYDKSERMLRTLAHVQRIGALDRVVLLEEPFEEKSQESVRELPVLVAADESAITPEDTARRIEQGYGAIAVKPTAKTLSNTFDIIHTAHERGVGCFIADLTVHPTLLEWHRALSARLAPLPGMTDGLLETNGWQNYRNWPDMNARYPAGSAPWAQPRDGAFVLDEEFYSESGKALFGQ